MHQRMIDRGEAARALYQKFLAVVFVRPASYATPSAPRKPTRTAGTDQLFTISQLHSLFTPTTITSIKPLPEIPVPENLLQVNAAVPAPPPTWPGITEPFAGKPFGHFSASYRHGTGSGWSSVPSALTASNPNATPAAIACRASRYSSGTSRVDLVDATTNNRPTSRNREIHSRQAGCFTHAFRGSCSRHACRWSHDVVPAGFYESRKLGASNRVDLQQRVQARMAFQYDVAVELGLLDPTEDAQNGPDASEEIVAGLDHSDA